MRIGNPRVTLSLLAIVAGIAFFDFATPRAYGFALFYLLAVIAAAWWVGQRAALLVAAVSALAWFFVALATGDAGAGPALAWNSLSRVVIFLGAAFLVSRERARFASLQGENERVFKLAITDDLTGLYNRHFMKEEGNRMVALAIRHRRPFSLVAIRLVAVEGSRDRALQAAAQLLLKHLPEGDLAFRIGEVSLLAALPEATEETAAGVAATFQRAAERAVELTAREVRVETATATWRFGLSFDDVLDSALAALPEVA